MSSTLQEVNHVMSLPIIEQFSSGKKYHLILAIIMILTHATILCVSGASLVLALNQAESNYQMSNIGLQVAQYFTAAPQEYSVQDFVDFIIMHPIFPNVDP
ncbi:hypothetical protein BJV78DRAFT_420649 [Lactifluus subvellereus]|nr:hypothetical protein BJV78DRAFT_420649 [Lactifluus subvellereus]